MSFATGTIDSRASTTGDQAYTGIGFQPEALILWTQDLTAVGQQTTAQEVIQGFSDGTNDCCQAQYLNAGSGTGHVNLFSSTAIIDNASAGGSLTATVVSFDSDGFTLNFSAVEANARKIVYLAFEGFDNVEAGTTTTSGASSADHSVSLTGSFQPDCVILFGRNSTDHNVGWGWTVGSGIGDEAATSVRYRDGNRQRYQSHDNEMCYIAADDSATPNAEFFLNTFDSGGFTLSRTGATNANSIGYLATKGASWAAGNVQSPTTATTVSATGESFQPEGVLFIPVRATSVDADTNGYPTSWGCMDGSGGEGAMSCVLAVGSSPGASTELSNTKAVTFHDSGGTLIEAADYSAMTSDGFTLSYSTAETSQNYVFYLAFKGAAAVAGGAPPLLTLLGVG